MRRRFLWGVAVLFLVLSAWLIGAAALVAWIAGRVFGVIEGPPLAVILALPGTFLALLIFGGVAFAARAFRRVAAPVGELVDALGRVAAGEPSVRMRERGPREVRAVTAAFNTMAERLERSEAQRRTLLADVTHELRTPLAVIQAQVEGLLDQVYPPDEAHLAPILEQTRVLSRLIDDLRTLSLAESGALELHREATDLRALVEQSAAPFRTQATAAGVELTLTMPPDLPLVEIDPVRIREVLSNVLTNALRHTPRGGAVVISAAVDPARPAVSLAVRDTGTGIAPDVLPRVFDRFYRSGDSLGSGLGLAIAKGLVSAHGGDITAESDGPGRGTTVRFTIALPGSALA